MEKTKKGYAILIIAFLTAVALMCQLITFEPKAKADAASNEYEALYYISDYSGSEEYFDGFISQCAREVNPEISLNYQMYYNFEEIFMYFDSINYNNVRNSYIILEIRQQIPLQIVGEIEEWMRDVYDEETISTLESCLVPTEEDLYTYRLCTVLRTLKENECKIMTISGTDDSKLSEENGEFLQYADININLDVFTWFMYNYFDYISENIDLAYLDESNTLNLIFDENMSQPWTFKEYFNPFFRTQYEVEDDIYSSYDNWLDKSQYINIVMSDMRSYYESNDQKLVPYNLKTYIDLYGEDASGALAFPIGDSLGVPIWTEYWERDIDMAAEHGYEINRKYYFIRSISSYVPSLDELFVLGVRLSHINDWLPDMIEDFIKNGDLSVYNNYMGRCNVSYIAIDDENNACEWLTPQSIAGWHSVMTTNQYLMYNGYYQEK